MAECELFTHLSASTYTHHPPSPHPQSSSTEARCDTTGLAGQKHPHPPPSPKEDSSDEELWAAMETVEDESTDRAKRKKRVRRSKGNGV